MAWKHDFIMVGLCAFGLGCATVPAPTNDVADARAAIRAAKELGANDVAAARLPLRTAEEQVASAEKLIKDGENEEAALYLERAEADAELALALVRLKKSREEAGGAMEELRALRTEGADTAAQ